MLIAVRYMAIVNQGDRGNDDRCNNQQKGNTQYVLYTWNLITFFTNNNKTRGKNLFFFIFFTGEKFPFRIFMIIFSPRIITNDLKFKTNFQLQWFTFGPSGSSRKRPMKTTMRRIRDTIGIPETSSGTRIHPTISNLK